MSKANASINSAIKSYLEKTNRPFSANDILNNMHKQFGKTALLKALDELSANRLIREKVNGKQKLYFADQSNFADVSPTKMKQLDERINELSSTFNKWRETVRTKETRLASLKNSLTLQQIQTQTSECNAEIQALKTRLEAIESSTQRVKGDDKALDNEKAKRERNKLVSEWRKRKRMACSMVDAILEGYPKPKKVLVEEIGLETDEDCKVNVPHI